MCACFSEPYPPPHWNVTLLMAYFCMQGGGVDIAGCFERSSYSYSYSYSDSELDACTSIGRFVNCALYGNAASGVSACI